MYYYQDQMIMIFIVLVHTMESPYKIKSRHEADFPFCVSRYTQCFFSIIRETHPWIWTRGRFCSFCVSRYTLCLFIYYPLFERSKGQKLFIRRCSYYAPHMFFFISASLALSKTRPLMVKGRVSNRYCR